MIDDAADDSPESAARLSAVTRQLSEQSRPQAIAPGAAGNPIDAEKLAMETLFAALEERGVHNPKKLTEFEVYARLDAYKKQAKKG